MSVCQAANLSYKHSYLIGTSQNELNHTPVAGYRPRLAASRAAVRLSTDALPHPCRRPLVGCRRFHGRDTAGLRDLGRTFGPDAPWPASARLRSTSSRPTTPSRSPSISRASTRPPSACSSRATRCSSSARRSSRRAGGDSSFHLVERGFGRFARIVRLAAAVRRLAGARDDGGGRAARDDSEARRPPRPRVSRAHRTGLNAHPLHRRHHGPARPRAGPPRPRGHRRPPRDRPRDRQRGELRGRLRHHARDRRAAARLGRRRDDLGQSHLGQERSARLHRHRAAPAPPGQLPGRRPGQRQLPRADRRRPVGRRDQRHGPRVHGEHRRPVRGGAREIEALRERARDHLRGLPRRGDLGEDGDGLASRRQGDGGRRHAHARADRRRAHPAEGNGVPDRRRA